LGIQHQKGNLSFGCDADFIMLDDNLKVLSTWIAGDCVYECADEIVSKPTTEWTRGDSYVY
jgi:N-acetylglucosamine-6-phosphate deacetylase